MSMAAKVRTLCKEDKASNAAQFCSSKHSEANQHSENRCTRILIQQKYRVFLFCVYKINHI